MSGDPVLVAGRVTPAPDGPRVEQVGWGVARQVVRRWAGGPDAAVPALLQRASDLAERPGHAAYAVFVDRDVVAVALVALAVPEGSYLGEVLAPHAPAEAGRALLVRALHDLGAAGGERLRVLGPAPDLAGFEVVSAR